MFRKSKSEALAKIKADWQAKVNAKKQPGERCAVCKQVRAVYWRGDLPSPVGGMMVERVLCVGCYEQMQGEDEQKQWNAFRKQFLSAMDAKRVDCSDTVSIIPSER